MTRSFLPFLRQLLEESEKIIMPWYRNPALQVDLKADATPVTVADRRAEEALRERIRKKYPAHGIIGEEFGSENSDAEFVWVLDPIDGTKSFAHGCPLFGTLIALLHGGRPVLGAINLPALGQTCIGDGRQTTLNAHPVRCRVQRDLAQATVLATDIRSIGLYQDRAGFERLLAQINMFRTWGDCYGYVQLAAGWADVMLDPIMNPWDLMALIPVVAGAGGVITAWDGGDAVAGTSAVAAGPALHAQVLAVLHRSV